MHTSGECAMEAAMTHDALEAIGTGVFDLLFPENVGNLVCPAEQDVGASANVALLSLLEGDDKLLKYPLIFQICQAILVTKTDTSEYFSFDNQVFVKHVYELNPEAEVFFISAKSGEGMDMWLDWLETQRCANTIDRRTPASISEAGVYYQRSLFLFFSR